MNSPVNVWEVGQFRLEEHHSAGRGTTFELRESRGSYCITIFPHELVHLEAMLGSVRASQPVRDLALAKERETA